MSRSLLAAVVAALAAIMPAAAWAQDGPTLTFDKPCYAEGDPMEYAGTGYTPGGEVNFLFSSLSNQATGTYDTHADARGRDRRHDRTRRPRTTSSTTVTSPGRWASPPTTGPASTRAAPAEQQFAGTSFRLHALGRRASTASTAARRGPRKPMRVTAVRLHAGDRRDALSAVPPRRQARKTVRLGRLGGECGDLTRTLTARRCRAACAPGATRSCSTTSPRAIDGERVWFRADGCASGPPPPRPRAAAARGRVTAARRAPTATTSPSSPACSCAPRRRGRARPAPAPSPRARGRRRRGGSATTTTRARARRPRSIAASTIARTSPPIDSYQPRTVSWSWVPV